MLPPKNKKKKPENDTWMTHVDRPGIINSETLKGADDDTLTRLVLSNRSRQLYIVQIEAVKIDRRLNQIPCPSPRQPPLTSSSLSAHFPQIPLPLYVRTTAANTTWNTYIYTYIHTHTYTYRYLYMCVGGTDQKRSLYFS